MTATSGTAGTTGTSGPLSVTGAGDEAHEGIRLAHLRVGLPVSTPDRPTARERERELSEELAPFVAWLATQQIDELGRRRHRDAVERFLRWIPTDVGPVESRGRRYEHHLHDGDPSHLAAARAGLEWWIDHRRILALTDTVGP